jgi:hypothetical protein
VGRLSRIAYRGAGVEEPESSQDRRIGRGFSR